MIFRNSEVVLVKVRNGVIFGVFEENQKELLID